MSRVQGPREGVVETGKRHAFFSTGVYSWGDGAHQLPCVGEAAQRV